MEPTWLDWAKGLQAIAQNGLVSSHDHFDVERYRQVQQVAAEILSTSSGQGVHATRGLLDQQVKFRRSG